MVQDLGEKELPYMKKQMDKNMPVGKLIKIDDFLPSPNQLVEAEETQKITIMLNKKSITYFKKLAAKHHTKYQPLIRRLVEKYVDRFSHK